MLVPLFPGCTGRVNLEEFFLLPYHMAFGVLAPHPGIEPVFPSAEARSPNNREAPDLTLKL